MTFEEELERTLAFVRELGKGRRLPLRRGGTLCMGEDMSIGFLIHDTRGNEVIGGLSTLDLRALNRLLNEEGITAFVPLPIR